MFLATFCQAQTPGKTAVFKVRAQPSVCTITCKDKFFLLEMNNPVVITVKGRNKSVVVSVTGGNVLSQEGDTYFVRFVRPGAGLITVYQFTPTGRKVLAAKMQVVKNPEIYFCGIKMDSTSKRIKMTGMNFYAYSDYYKQNMPFASFDMYFVNDTTVKKIEPIEIKSDTCMLTSDMKKKILNFQPRFNYIYFHNIVCRVPDGSKRILDPIELKVIVDTTDREKLSLIYSVRKKKM